MLNLAFVIKNGSGVATALHNMIVPHVPKYDPCWARSNECEIDPSLGQANAEWSSDV
jgi:hypothetical protein